MDRLYAERDTYIERPPQEVFAFLCDPNVDQAEITPFEDRVTEQSTEPGVGAICRTTVELAARDLDCISRCIEFDPPRRLVMQLEGDLTGRQAWELEPQDNGTRAHLTVDIVAPTWLPQYLRDDRTAANWTTMLADQTLQNVKSALE
jgi:carbon monoxide dehydrogenase subunit G